MEEGREQEQRGGRRPEDDPPGERGTGKYVYCIIRTSRDQEFGPIGIGGGNPVYTLRHGELSAVVSDTPIQIYDPTRENILAHESVNKVVMEDHTVIPMSFGTIFRTEDDILALLDSTSAALEDVLEKMENKIELGIKVLWDRDNVAARVEAEDEDIARLKAEVKSASRGSTYFARVQLERMVEQALERKANEYVTEIYEALSPVAVASRSNKPIGENMIMNAAFLVERTREDAFDQAVKELGARYGELLSFTFTGPWPPYNFVNIKLRLEPAGEG